MAEPRTVGVRELRQNLCVYLREVEAGYAYEVTARGRTVALLSPLHDELDTWERLIAEGRVTPAKRPVSSLPRPLRSRGGRPISEILDDLREDRV